MLTLEKTKILFLGYGAVAKCTWNYMKYYIQIESANVYMVDQNEKAFYGFTIEKTRCIHMHVSSLNFQSLLENINIKEGDIIIDLTYASDTYFFIKTCLLNGINYINTSIEDHSDTCKGRSISIQHKKIKEIYHECKNHVNSFVLTECGQNPGLIQHYVLYALQRLHQLKHPETVDFSKETLCNVIKEYEIGTILMSEIDTLSTSRELKEGMIYNTWSVAGFISEAYDPVELVKGNNNVFIKPNFTKIEKDPFLTKMYQSYKETEEYDVFFLKENGMNSYLYSVCPLFDNNNQIINQTFCGRLIHHGEIIDLANYFGDMSPFMSYVYQVNSHLENSLFNIKNMYPTIDENYIMNSLIQLNNYSVFDNFNQKQSNHLIGQDSIGCTIFCGTNEINHIYWCGSILKHDDVTIKEFTPTTVQVAAGILSGLSFMLSNKCTGIYQPSDLNTAYMLEKSIPLLGNFFFTEIPKEDYFFTTLEI